MDIIDVVTVYHNPTNEVQAGELRAALEGFDGGRINFIAHSNRDDNVGFARGCNLGAALGHAPVVGFLNPDVRVHGSIAGPVLRTLADELVVITGCRFGKPDAELAVWGVREWVCGAAMFVRRAWWESVGGFDEQFVWAWEETDLIRRAETAGFAVRPIDLPIEHSSPTDDSITDRAYKHQHFNDGADRYRAKWRGR